MTFALFTLIYNGHVVVQSVEALRYKPGGREFDSRWCKWNCFINVILPTDVLGFKGLRCLV
jgi:hypothetical protein